MLKLHGEYPPNYLMTFIRQHKYLISLICNKMKYESVRELLSSLNMLNVYQINILNNA